MVKHVVQVYTIKKSKVQSLSNLPKGTQLLSGGKRIHTIIISMPSQRARDFPSLYGVHFFGEQLLGLSVRQVVLQTRQHLQGKQLDIGSWLEHLEKDTRCFPTLDSMSIKCFFH